MPKNQPKYDLSTPLSQGEAGRVRTLLQANGIRVLYRELVGFSPTDAITLKALAGKMFRGKKLTADMLAELAGREIIGSGEEVESIEDT